MATQRWSISQSHIALPGKLIKGKLRHTKSDLDIRHSTLNSFTPTKAISIKKDTFDAHFANTRVPFQKEYNLVLLGQASVGKSGKFYEL